MTDVRAQDHVMAGMEVDGLGVALDAETGPAPQDDDPLVGVLREPLAWRGDVAGRHDPLDPHAGRSQQDVDLFGREVGGKVVEEAAQAVSIASRLVTSR
jgi:hypothetical protein